MSDQSTRPMRTDQHYHEAVGWLLSMLDGRQLAEGSRQAKRAGCPEVARNLLRWADQKADTSPLVGWADREQERANVRDLLVSLVMDEDEDA